MSDRIFAGLWLTLCLGGMMVAWQNPERIQEPVGPRPFPMAIYALLMLFRKPDTIHWPASSTLKRLVALALMMLLYGWLFETLGFAICTTLLTFGIGLLFGARWWSAALAGLVMGSTLFYAFDRLLEVTLPVGSWLS